MQSISTGDKRSVFRLGAASVCQSDRPRPPDVWVDEAAILSLSGEVFGPGLEGYLRLVFGNIPRGGDPRGGPAFPGDGCMVFFSGMGEGGFG